MNWKIIGTSGSWQMITITFMNPCMHLVDYENLDEEEYYYYTPDYSLEQIADSLKHMYDFVKKMNIPPIMKFIRPIGTGVILSLQRRRN